MPLTVKHAYQSAIVSDPAADIGTDEWNADHQITGSAAPDRLWTPGGTVNALDDEFSNASLDASWIRVDASGDAGHLTYTEDADVLSLYHNGVDAGDELHGLVKSLGGATFPITLQTACRWYTPYAYNYLMLGLIFADGTTHGAGKQIIVMPYTHSAIATAVRLSMRAGVNWNTFNQGTYDAGDRQVVGSVGFHWRLRWTAANTFYADVSPDGVSWHTFAGPVTYSMTPTHAGIILSTWGQTQQVVIGTYDYFRVR